VLISVVVKTIISRKVINHSVLYHIALFTPYVRLSCHSWIAPHACARATHAAGDILPIVSASALPYDGLGEIRLHYSWSGIGTRRWGRGSGWAGFFFWRAVTSISMDFQWISRISLKTGNTFFPTAVARL
jgi:hypothetical protein